MPKQRKMAVKTKAEKRTETLNKHKKGKATLNSKNSYRIGWIEDKYLPKIQNKTSRGHYVIVTSTDKSGKKGIVWTFTSLCNHIGEIILPKIKMIFGGFVCPLKDKDCDLPRASGLHGNPHENVDLSQIDYSANHSVNKKAIDKAIKWLNDD